LPLFALESLVFYDDARFMRL